MKTRHMGLVICGLLLAACQAETIPEINEDVDLKQVQQMLDNAKAINSRQDLYDNKVIASDGGEIVENPFHPVTLLLSKNESAGQVSFYEFRVPPKSPGSPPHTHTHDDEYFFITSGTLSVMSGDDILELPAGGFAALNRGNPHMFWNGGDEEVTLIMATTGGAFEDFMAKVAPTMAEAKPASPEEAGAVMGQLAAEHDIFISMEAMPPEAAPYYQP